MALLTVEEIRKGLDQEFIPLEPMITGLRLINGGVSEDVLGIFENENKISFPDDFRCLIKKIDFGNLTVGPVVFCNGGDYLKELFQLNVEMAWWGRGGRPKDLFVIANSDPYVIILNIKTGNILAADFEIGWQCAKKIASNFDFYLRGVGTTMLRRNEVGNRCAFAKTIMKDVGGADLTYWSQLAG